MGFFSWFTQDTNRSIANASSKTSTFTVYMIDDASNQYREDHYIGYGEFGGKDYYQLLAEMNMVDPIYHNRDVGIDLEFNTHLVEGERKHKNVIFPTLVENVYVSNNWRNEKPESCPDQGFFYSYSIFEDEDDNW